MKKLAILFSMFAVVALTSCGGGENKEAENTDSVATEAEPKTEEVVTPEVDTTAKADTTVTDPATPAE